MVKEELKYQILQQFGFQPTSEQAHALEVFAQFLTDTTPHCAMILRGSAGTGKTPSRVPSYVPCRLSVRRSCF